MHAEPHRRAAQTNRRERDDAERHCAAPQRLHRRHTDRGYVPDRAPLLEDEERRGDIRDPVTTISRETSLQQYANRGRRRRRQCGPVRLAHEDGGERVAHILALERPMAAKHLEEYTPEPPDVGA